MNPILTLSPQKSGISQNGGTLDLLIRVQAPPAPPESIRTRSPLHLALVLDRSGSMHGTPLEEAKRCAEMIIERLKPSDRAAVVVFDHTVQTLVPLRSVESPAPFREPLRGLTSGGNTALHGGWLQGATELAPYVESGTLSRVVLLSDGQANEGLTVPAPIFAQCAEMAEADIVTSTIGLGRSFNEELMVGMAQKGRGKHYYGQTAEDLLDAFSEELDLAESLHSRNLRASVVPGPGVIVEVLSQDGVRADAQIPISDLAYEAEAWLLVRLHHGAKSAGVHSLLSVTVSGVLSNGDAYSVGPTLLELPALPVPVFSQLDTDTLVATRTGESAAARLLLAFRRCLVNGDRGGAEMALKEAQKLGRENPWIAESVAEMERLLTQDEALAAKEALYTAGKLQTRLAAPSETLYQRDETESPDIPTFLRRKGSQGRGKRE